MKTIILLILLLINLIGNAQCPAPSNLTLSIPNPTSAQLAWTENGTATIWNVAVAPDFIVGATFPTDVWAATTINPFILTDLPPGYGCYVFFVRSVCSATEVSPWSAISTSGCSNDVNIYLANLLSNNNFSLIADTKELQIAPNPSNKVVQLNLNSIIDKITLLDPLGKVVLIQTQNTNEIDIENLSKGVYFIHVVSENKHFCKKFIKE